MGRSPQIIEDQITYPLVAIPNIKYVRADTMAGHDSSKM
ncbi:Cobalt-zinc-cadmium resistance protein CzcA [Arcticibacter svalbardensis MN12-7]|uniref:Cobalt-zinc-cadmium resistance protein CzcA n=1 Tax=Arcticibacter svalbardensis MN12-7 TaxID=1150600 RepID=R9GT91_9SPHI|nr:Cobalt-zinc-cadmium resistance protein CzcA [Arcticibacter svalbardensis MN12-7]